MTIRRIARIKEIIGRFSRLRASQGFCSATISSVRTIVGGLFSCSDCFLYACSLDKPLPIIEPISNLLFREAQVSDLCLFEEVKQPSDVLWYETLLERKRVCVMAFKEEELAAHGWFSVEVDPVTERTYVPLAQDEAFIFDLFTLPSFRRQGIQSALLHHMLELIKERGYRRALSLVRVGNTASSNLHEKLGFQVVSRFAKVRVLGLVFFRFRPNLFGRAGSVVRWF
jgi:ribosomal protein S18 acetylase RimI-like enzyme